LVFLAKTKTPDEWKAVTSAISTMVDEATFEATVEGLSFRGMDPSHVALIDINWPNSAFDGYECDAALKFGVRIDEFSKLMKSMLYIKILNGYKREYKMRLIESTGGSTPLPKLNFNSKVILTPASFDKILSDIEVVSEYISIESDEKKITFSGKSDYGEADIVIEEASEGLEELLVKEKSKATYSLDYLSKITKAISVSGGSLVLEYSTKMPLRLEFRVANVGRIHFYLAPRVQD
jgi:proliferating cell nuclear antigen